MHRIAIVSLALLASVGCGSKEAYVDLDGVLDIFAETLAEADAALPPAEAPPTEPTEPTEATDGAAASDGTEAVAGGEAVPEEAPAEEAAPAEPSIVVIAPTDASVEAENAFAMMFSNRLNMNPERIAYHQPLGVSLQADGSWKGFEDPNLDGVQDAGEKDVFAVEVDYERERLVATDLQHSGYHRDASVRRTGMGMMTGYMIGRMMGGQQAAGVSSSKFSGMSMKPSGYHSSTGASRVSGGARSMGGSRAPSIGK